MYLCLFILLTVYSQFCYKSCYEIYYVLYIDYIMKDYSLKLSYIISSNKKRNISKVTNKTYEQLSPLSPFAHRNSYNNIYTSHLYEQRKYTESDTIF